MRLVFLLAPLALMACTPSTVSFSGSKMTDHFPFDGERSWEFISSDTTLDYTIKAEVVGDAEVFDKRNVYTVSYWSYCFGNDPECIEEELWSMRWASDVTDGVFVYGWDVGGGPVSHSPPIQVADAQMVKDDSVATKTGGVDWNSTLFSFEDCPVRMNVDWPECARFEIEGTEGSPLAGTIWANVGYNVVAFQRAGEEQIWELSEHNCEGDCNGIW